MTTQTADQPARSTESRRHQHTERLRALREKMAQHGVDALIVRSTDRYLNEYVPQAESTREWLTGFTGSMGDALVTREAAFVVVDGRYHLQADQETDPAHWTVVKLSMAEPIYSGVLGKLQEQVRSGAVKAVGYETDRFTVHEREALDRMLEGTTAKSVPLAVSPVEEVRGPVRLKPGELRILDEARVGRSAAEKVAAVQKALEQAGLDLFLVQKLDDLAYLTNLRADELPYQATFKGMGAVGRQGALVCFHSRTAPEALPAARPGFRFVDEKALPQALQEIAGPGRKAAYDASATTEAARQLLVAAGFTALPMSGPLTEMKARKTGAELTRMVEAFRKADRVVSQAISWLCRAVEKGEKVTEADFASKVEKTFRRSGAVGLSFKVISAAGANGAIIHYSTPDPERVIQRGELMLLDTGAYYEDGYATDLTRTFLAGGSRTQATDEQKRLYTLTLKSAIAGMTAVVPQGVSGVALDAITRKPLWDHGLNYNHGTGHGVGINVHEAPPSISMRSTTPLGAGYVFSIEPGVYLPGWGGIRIENLCTLEEHPEHKGWLRVKPLTFSPLDPRLIDQKLLSPSEKAFVKEFQAQGKAALRAQA
ncbi:MAG: M24 family metallopeptidase [Myxococcota bacterium]